MVRTFVIGHAGAGGEAPENTLAGVRACLAAGVEGMEIDVQISRDGVPILLHDTTLDRTTGLRGPLLAFSLAELQAADAGGGEPVPSLAQVLDLVDGAFTVMIELKVDYDTEAVDLPLLDGVLAAIRKRSAESWCGLHSFHPGIVAAARERAPEISAAIISIPVQGPAGLERLIRATLRRNAQAISLEHRAITAETVRKVKARQLSLWAWTADSPADWDRLIDAGVDGIITNVPGKLRRHLGG